MPDPARAILRVRCAMLAAERQRMAMTLAVWPLLLALVVAAVCWWRVMP